MNQKQKTTQMKMGQRMVQTKTIRQPKIKAPKVEDFNGPKKSRTAFFIFADMKRPGVMEKLKAETYKSKIPEPWPP